MTYTHLGNTGLEVSSICMGCMSFGKPGWIGWDWVMDGEAAKPFFRAAVEAGINFFDTADSYSDGHSEEIVGKWLGEFANRDEVVIATKVFWGPDRPNMHGLSRKHIQQACEGSLRRLGVETIDLYQIHRLDYETPIEETLEALNSLVREGKVRYIGASSMYAWEFMRALDISDRNGWARFVSMQNHYNLLYREEEREMAPLCEGEGVGMIPWSPLARGLLARSPAADRASGAIAGEGGAVAAPTERAASDPLVQFYQTDADQQIRQTVAAIADDRGVKPSQVALAWLFRQPALAAPIVGVSKLNHLEDAIGAVGIELTDEECERLESPYVARPTIGITPPFGPPRPGRIHDRG